MAGKIVVIGSANADFVIHSPKFPCLGETLVGSNFEINDCFIGAIVSKLCQNEAVGDAIAFATKASSITVSREGASKSIPLEHEIN